MQALVMKNNIGASGNLEKIFEKKFTTLISPNWGGSAVTSRSETLITFSDFVSPHDVSSIVVKVFGSYYVNNLTQFEDNAHGYIKFVNMGSNSYFPKEFWGNMQTDAFKTSGRHSGTFIAEYYSTYNAFISLAELKTNDSVSPVTGMYLLMNIDGGFRMSISPNFTIQVYAQKLNLN